MKRSVFSYVKFRRLQHFLLVAVLFYISISLKGQSYSFTHYQVENGLLNNSVLCIAQDNNGFLWFGTRDGINRFDGYDFKNYYPDQRYERRSNFINCLMSDSRGNIWAGLENGIYRYNDTTDTFRPFLRVLKNIRSLCFDSANRMWISSQTNLYCYDFAKNHLNRYIPDNHSRIDCITEINGVIWVGTLAGDLYCIDPVKGAFQQFNIYAHSPEAVSKGLTKIVSDDNGDIMIGTMAQGIKRFDINRHSYEDLLMYNPDRSSIYVRDILKVGKKEFWFATESGIYIYNGGASNKPIHIVKNAVNGYALSDNAIYSLYLDHEKGIWVGTYFGGVNYYNKYGASRFQKYLQDNTTNSLSGNAVREICGDVFGNIWIGTEDAGLNKLCPLTGSICQFQATGKPGSISYSNIHGLASVGDKLWVGTYFHGLDVLNIKTGKVEKHYTAGFGKGKFMNNFITSLLYTRKKELYVGTEHSLYRYDCSNKSFSDQILQGKNMDFAVFCLMEDSKGIIWIGSYETGLYSLDPQTGIYKNYVYRTTDRHWHPSSNRINYIFEDSRHNIWIGTEGGGLCLLDRKSGKIVPYNNQIGFSDDFILKIQEDDHKNLWIATSKGLLELDSSREKYLRFTTADGLPTNQFNYGSAYKDKNGHLYFGTIKGMISFNPDDFKYAHLKAHIYITGFQVGQRELNPVKDKKSLHRPIMFADTVILKYDQSSFSIRFAALCFAAPHATSYEYIMENFQKQWTLLHSNQRVFFTNVPPGKYIFKVRAFSKEFSSVPEKKLIIIVTAPIWANSWAYLLYTLLAAILIYYLLQTYSNRLKHKKEKEIYEAKIEFFTSLTHEIKTPLTLIKGPVENLNEMIDEYPEIGEDVKMIDKNADRLSGLITQLMDFRKTEVKGFQLDLVKADIRELLKDNFEDFKSLARHKNISYILQFPEDKMYVKMDVDAMRKVFNNLFSNALKYANSEINVSIERRYNENDHIIISFENDGILIPKELRKRIFDPFFRLQHTKQKGTGIGLTVAKSLIELHGGKLYCAEKTNKENLNVFVIELPYAQ